MIQLFNIPNYKIDTAKFSHYLHGSIVDEFEENFCKYVGAKYACSLNSATNAIWLSMLNKKEFVHVPTMIPPVVLNALILSKNKILFKDNIDWIGDSYVLHKENGFKIIDSAQKVEKNQFLKEANHKDLMIFSFYPTKPVGSTDGGIIVSNDKKKIEHLRTLSFNGQTNEKNNWDRKIKMPGYKFYLNSIQAYIANENLKRLPEKKEKLQKIRSIYNDAFNLQNTSYHLYRLAVKNNAEFINYMHKNGVVCGIHYKCMHLNNVYKKHAMNCNHSFLSSILASITTASIPFHEKLTTKQINKVIKLVSKFA